MSWSCRCCLSPEPTPPGDATAPPPPCPSSDRPPALSWPPPLPRRNPCSCPGWDRGHAAAALARAVVVAVAVAVVVVVGSAVEVPPPVGIAGAGRKLRFGGDVVADGRESIGRVGWRTGRVKVRKMRSLRRMYVRKPWGVRS